VRHIFRRAFHIVSHGLRFGQPRPGSWSVERPVALSAIKSAKDNDDRAKIARMTYTLPSGDTKLCFWQQGGGHDRQKHPEQQRTLPGDGRQLKLRGALPH